MSKILALWVPGVPVPQGSMRSPKAGVVIHNSKALMGWRDSIGYLAKQEWAGRELLDEPCMLVADFFITKPKRPHNKDFPDTKPDLDKLLRAIGDALQGVVLKEDSRIVRVLVRKLWADEKPGLLMTLEPVQ